MALTKIAGRSLTPSTPATAAVTDSASTVVAANVDRRAMVITNTGSVRVSLGFGTTAILDKGVTLMAGASLSLTEYMSLSVSAITTAAGSTLSIQEFT